MIYLDPAGKVRLAKARKLVATGKTVPEAIKASMTDVVDQARRNLLWSALEERLVPQSKQAKPNVVKNKKPAPVGNLLGDARKHEWRQLLLTKYDL